MVRTDLALEAREYLLESATDIKGVVYEETEIGNCSINRIIVEKEGEGNIGYPAGKYTTVHFGAISGLSREDFENIVDITAHEISTLIDINKISNVLVCGLGNSRITPDALGPRVLDSLLITRHINGSIALFFHDKLRSVAAISPGVLGQTGVETAEMVKSVVDKIKPDLIIVIDALAARKLTRVATTVQVSSVGLSPGSGVGNKRSAVNFDSMGVPVISIGVPTIVDAATLSNDVFSLLENKEDDENSERVRHIADILSPKNLNLMVTPTDIDYVIDISSKIVGFAINRALQKNISIEEMEKILA